MTTSPSTPAAPGRALFAPRFPRPSRADSGVLVFCVWLLLGWATLTVAAAQRGRASPASPGAAATSVASSEACGVRARC